MGEMEVDCLHFRDDAIGSVALSLPFNLRKMTCMKHLKCPWPSHCVKTLRSM